LIKIIILEKTSKSIKTEKCFSVFWLFCTKGGFLFDFLLKLGII
jgi:hypothetical protein